MRFLLIANPRAGSYSEKKIAFAAESLAVHYDVSIVETLFEPPDIDTICVACGGDGTVNYVLNHIQPGGILGFLPLGTGNVLAWELGIRSYNEALDKLLLANIMPVNAGMVETSKGKAYFVLMAGVGADAYIVKGLRTEERKMFGKMAFVLSFFRHLLHGDKKDIKVLLPDHEISCHSLVIANARHYAGSIPISRRTNIFKTGFEIVFIPYGDSWGFFRRGYFDCDSLRVEGEKPIQIDGELFGTTPAIFTMLPDFFRIVA